MVAFIKTSKRKARKSGAKMRRYGKARAAVRERDGGRCRVCHRPGYHTHHIVFRSQGGTDTTDNLCIVCLDCHNDIHNRKIFVTGNADEMLQIETRGA